MSTAVLVPTVIDGRGFRLRHIAPTARFASQGATATILGRSYGFTELPIGHLPTSAGLVDGTYTGRLGDAGEARLTFPNAASAAGLWRERFSTDLALEFVEIYRDDVLEFVMSVQRIEIDRGTVIVSGPDAWALLRRVYERDRAWTGSPAEVIAAATRVPIPVVVDDFNGGALDARWKSYGGASIDVTGDGRARVIKGVSSVGGIYADSLSWLSDSWRVDVAIDKLTVDAVGVYDIELHVADAAFTRTYGALYYGGAPNRGELKTFDGTTEWTVAVAMPTKPQFKGAVTLSLVRQGRWIAGFVDAKLIGFLPVPAGSQQRIDVRAGTASGGNFSLFIESIACIELKPFLQRGSDGGDYVLPGAQPPGGLRGRYFDGANLQGLTSPARAGRLLSPDRAFYAERLDATVDSAAIALPVQPGNSGQFFAVRWFGSVYLRGDLGSYTFEATSVTDGVRLWVGKTGWGDQLIDSWVAASGTKTATWTAANYGAKAGWYPIVLEFFCDTAAPAITLKFTPPATGYTDPGGTAIAASTKVTIPASSLSPLGCFDQRVQGTSHFDLVQQAAKAFGYQMWCEPMSLESGKFPGRLVPRVRVGRDTNVVLRPDDTDRAEPALSPGVTLDGSDQAVALIGAGAGIADGNGAQALVTVRDLSRVGSGLFALEAWVDAGGIAFKDLLAATLNAELALRETPWAEVRATPRAQERLADTWPLTGTLAAMRWRPGDGLRIVVPDISVEDASPRQMLQVTRAFGAEGRTGTQVAFRQRPRSAARTLRGQIRSALALGRSYQGQRVTITGPLTNIPGASTAAAGFTELSMISLLPTDTVQRARIRVVVNTAAQPLLIFINGTSRSNELGGPWSVQPVDIDITGYATQVSATDNRLYAQMQNNGASATVIQFQLIVEVLR